MFFSGDEQYPLDLNPTIQKTSTIHLLSLPLHLSLSPLILGICTLGDVVNILEKKDMQAAHKTFPYFERKKGTTLKYACLFLIGKYPYNIR